MSQLRWAALALAALVLTGCETTQEKSAKLEADAKRQHLKALAVVTITRQSSVVKVAETAVVHASEGEAAVVTLRNTSGLAQRELPLKIVGRGPSGQAYTNATPGLAHSLVSAPLVPAHGELRWVDDQLPGGGAVTSLGAEVGEGRPATSVPQIAVSGLQRHQEGNSPEVSGTVGNHSTVAQKELVVYAVARQGARVTAAGRAVLPALEPGASSPFQVILVGSIPGGANLEVDAPPTTFG